MGKLAYSTLARFYDGIINDKNYDLWLDKLADLTFINSTNKFS